SSVTVSFGRRRALYRANRAASGPSGRRPMAITRIMTRSGRSRDGRVGQRPREHGNSVVLQCPAAPPGHRTQPQPQRIQLDEALGIYLVVCALVILERHDTGV